MYKNLKRVLRKVPGITILYNAALVRKFRGSADYWDRRYGNKGTSGDGSYGQLAQFKADVLNEFVATHAVKSVVELGCGDGNQLSLAQYPSYCGLDVARTAIKMCKENFADDPTKSFIYYDPELFVDKGAWLRGEMSMSLDVIYHLVEDEVFDTYMNHLFLFASRYVVVYSSNKDPDESALGALAVAPHIRHRKFTDWVERNQPQWELFDVVRNKFPLTSESPGSWADFYFYRPRQDV